MALRGPDAVVIFQIFAAATVLTPRALDAILNAPRAGAAVIGSERVDAHAAGPTARAPLLVPRVAARGERAIGGNEGSTAPPVIAPGEQL